MVGGVDCLAEKLARLDSVVAATEESAEVGQGAGVFQAGIGAGEYLDRLAQKGVATKAAGYQPRPAAPRPGRAGHRRRGLTRALRR